METVKMSTKGQVVIPKRLRQKVNAEEGTLFAAIAEGDAIVLKRIDKPDRKEVLKRIARLAKRGRELLEAEGWTEQDVIDAASRTRTSSSARRSGKASRKR